MENLTTRAFFTTQQRTQIHESTSETVRRVPRSVMSRSLFVRVGVPLQDHPVIGTAFIDDDCDCDVSLYLGCLEIAQSNQAFVNGKRPTFLSSRSGSLKSSKATSSKGIMKQCATTPSPCGSYSPWSPPPFACATPRASREAITSMVEKIDEVVHTGGYVVFSDAYWRHSKGSLNADQHRLYHIAREYLDYYPYCLAPSKEGRAAYFLTEAALEHRPLFRCKQIEDIYGTASYYTSEEAGKIQVEK